MSHYHKIENLQFLAQQVVEGFIIGLHKSPFHGFSVEFAEHRLYNLGDNLKHIDWKVYGRTDKLFTKRFEEETNLRCHIVIDTSASMDFPEQAQQYSKKEFSFIAAGAIMYMLKKQLDASAIHLFDDKIYFQSACRSSSVHYRNMNTELEKRLGIKSTASKSNTANIIHQIAENTHRRSLVVILSDMLDTVSEQEELLDALKHLKYNKHEVILFHVQDKKFEVDFDFENRPYEFIDLESQERVRMNSTALQKMYKEQMENFRKNIKVRCVQYGIDLIDADINQSFDQILLPYLLKRNAMV